MNIVFRKTLAAVLGVEGRYSNDPRDSGGETVFGISRRAWPRWEGWVIVDALRERPGFPQSLDGNAALRACVEDLYRREFWDRVAGDQVAQFSVPVAVELFDTQVNCPPGLAAKALQRALNLLNDPSGGTDARRALYPELVVDGAIGPRTLEALGELLAYRKHEGEQVLLAMQNVVQGVHYMDLAERRAKDKAFVYGWFRHRIQIPG